MTKPMPVPETDPLLDTLRREARLAGRQYQSHLWHKANGRQLPGIRSGACRRMRNVVRLAYHHGGCLALEYWTALESIGDAFRAGRVAEAEAGKTIDHFERLTAEDLVIAIRDMILVRNGEAVDLGLAAERARNIAAALKGTVIT